MITYLVIGFVVVMLIGNFMSAKPKDSELFLDNIRMMARQIQLMPTLLPTPDWLKAHVSANMVMFYTVVHDEWRLPLAYYVNNNGQWHRVNPPPALERQSDINFFKKTERLIGDIDVPAELLPFIQGLCIKANSVALVFDDEAFAKAIAKDKSIPESELRSQLLSLKMQLLAWGNKVSG